MGARRLGRTVAGSRRIARRDAGGRARLPEQAQQDAGLVPGAGDVPDLLRVRGGVGVRRTDPAGLGGSGQVQELLGDADLHEVEGALRPELGQGRHRQARPGGGVRGLHRRDRLPPCRRGSSRRHVWHGVDRGTRAAVEALREQGGARVRRRRRRPGRCGALLRMGATARRRGVGREAAAGQGSR